MSESARKSPGRKHLRRRVRGWLLIVAHASGGFSARRYAEDAEAEARAHAYRLRTGETADRYAAVHVEPIPDVGQDDP